MAKTYNNWGALKKALQDEMKKAMNEAVDKSFQDLHENVDYFYTVPEGRYHRTGQLAESPEQEVYGGGDNITGELRLDTSYVYNPSGRDTETIYGYAENNELIGQGGFWQQTEEDIEKNVKEAFGKRFDNA